MKPLIRNPDGTITVAEEGDGWVVVEVAEFAEMNPGDTIVSMTNNPDLPITVRRYVPPVSPLPTEPYTVIRTGVLRWVKCGTWHDGNMIGNPDAWLLLGGETPAENRRIHASHLQPQVIYDQKHVLEQAEGIGFEVLAEPQQPGSATYTSEQLNAVLDGAKRGTANAVLNRVRQTGIWQVVLLANPKNGAELDTIGRDFGVES